MALQRFSNNASTTLASNLNTGETEMTVSSSTLFSSIGVDEFESVTLVNDDNDVEIIHVTGRSGNTWTIVREQEGTTALPTWVAGTTVQGRITAASLQQFSNFVYNYIDDLANLDGDGDPRGTNALNLQPGRLFDSRVASGETSISLGFNNRSSDISTICIGNGGDANAVRAISIGSIDSAVPGSAPFAGGVDSICIGTGTDSGDLNGIAIGRGANTGDDFAIAIGTNADSGELSSIVIGNNALTGFGADYGIAIGDTAEAGDEDDIGIGHNALAEGDRTVAIGFTATTNGESAIAIGDAASAANDFAIAIGDLASAGEVTSIAIGAGASATELNSLAIGTSTSALQSGSVAIGNSASVDVFDNSINAVAIGFNSLAVGNESIALGKGAYTPFNNSVAIGPDVASSAIDQVAIGAKDLEIQSALHGIVLLNGNGERYRLTIDDLGRPTVRSLTTGSIVPPRETEFTVVDGVSPALNIANGSIQVWTLGANRSPEIILEAGQSMTLMITAGSNTITWPTMNWVGGAEPTLSTTEQTIIEIWKVGAVTYGVHVGDVAGVGI